MLSGKITLHEEKSTFTYQSPDYNWEDMRYGMAVPKDFEDQYETEVANALNKGYKIGNKVVRKTTSPSMSQLMGKIVGFKRGPRTWNPFSEQIEMLEVLWEGPYEYTSTYHPSELTLKEEVL